MAALKVGLARFHGVLAPNAKLRREIVPSPPEQATAPACDHAPARLSWARLLKRVFDIDIEHCPNCGGSLNIAHSHNRRIELNDATDKSHRIASSEKLVQSSRFPRPRGAQSPR